MWLGEHSTPIYTVGRPCCAGLTQRAIPTTAFSSTSTSNCPGRGQNAVPCAGHVCQPAAIRPRCWRAGVVRPVAPVPVDSLRWMSGRPFEWICEIEPPTRPDLMHVRHQIGVLSKVASAYLIPDNHVGRATVSIVAVAHEVDRMGGRAIACLNARDRKRARLPTRPPDRSRLRRR